MDGILVMLFLLYAVVPLMAVYLVFRNLGVAALRFFFYPTNALQNKSGIVALVQQNILIYCVICVNILRNMKYTNNVIKQGVH